MNYADLFRVTLPETALEVAALLVLVVDLGFLRKAALKTRVAVAALLGVAGCGAAFGGCCSARARRGTRATRDGELLAAPADFQPCADRDSGADGADAAAADRFGFHEACGRVCGRGADGGYGRIADCRAQDLLVIFIGLELLSLGLYILTAFAKSSGKSAEAAMKYYLFGGMSAAFLLFGFSYFMG
jgi:NADH-quinone oxidoreductase subunit N